MVTDFCTNTVNDIITVDGQPHNPEADVTLTNVGEHREVYDSIAVHIYQKTKGPLRREERRLHVFITQPEIEERCVSSLRNDRP